MIRGHFPVWVEGLSCLFPCFVEMNSGGEKVLIMKHCFHFFRADYLYHYPSIFPCSKSDSRLPETTQHEKQTGEQNRGCWAEEDPHGHHSGPPGSTGGESEQNSGFYWKQIKGLKGQQWASALLHISSYSISSCQVFSFFPFVFVLDDNMIKVFAYLRYGIYAKGYQSLEFSSVM